MIRRIYQITMFVQFVFLLIAGIDFFIHSSLSFFLTVLIGGLLLFDGICYLVFVVFNWTHGFYRYMFLLFLLVNIGLTFTDQVGLIDYIVLGLNVFIFIVILTGKDLILEK